MDILGNLYSDIKNVFTTISQKELKFTKRLKSIRVHYNSSYLATTSVPTAPYTNYFNGSLMVQFMFISLALQWISILASSPSNTKIRFTKVSINAIRNAVSSASPLLILSKKNFSSSYFRTGCINFS